MILSSLYVILRRSGKRSIAKIILRAMVEVLGSQKSINVIRIAIDVQMMSLPWLQASPTVVDIRTTGHAFASGHHHQARSITALGRNIATSAS